MSWVDVNTDRPLEESALVMAQLSDLDYTILNATGIAFGALGLVTALATIALLLYLRHKVPGTFSQAWESNPTRLLHLSLVISIPYSICYIWSSTSSAANQTICRFTMTGIVLFLHLMDATMLLILIHCAILVSTKDPVVTAKWTRALSAIAVVASFVLAFAGLFLHNYRYSDIQQTCWIYSPHGQPDVVIPVSLYGFECAILYGPVFLCILVSIILLAYIAISIGFVGRFRGNRKFRRMIIRIGVSPFFLLLHCLTILGGDLPIEYKTHSSMFACFFIGFAGYGSFALSFVICAVFVDPCIASCIKAMRKSKVSDDAIEVVEVNVSDSTIDEKI